jgi:Tfp pilus assembly protein PilV
MQSGSFVRFHARVHDDERGFSLLETVIAITVIFGALMTLAYSASVGFQYGSLARQRQTATGIADQIMEQTRGLAWDRITAGHLSSDLTADPNLVTSCAGDAAGVYRFLSCAAQTARPGSGERVVAGASSCASSTPDCVYPLVRHTGQITQNNIAYTWRTYDTNNCPTLTTGGCAATTPYRVTVIVTWTGGRAAPNKIVQVQSLFWSPTGCRSTSTHPFAAPCQPFFLGVSSVAQGNINVTGTVAGTTFESGDLSTSGVQSSVQQEQLSQAEGSFSQSGVRLVDSLGAATVAGDVAASSAADTDPGTGASTWSEVTCGTSVLCAGGAVSTGSSNTVVLTAPGGETAQSDSTTAAGAANICPPPPATGQTDGSPCSGSRIQQGGELSAVVTLNGAATPLGNATLARILAAAGSPNTTFSDRVQYNATGLCSPITGSDGCLEQTTTRAVGTVNVGALPENVPATSPWTGVNAWNGYYFSIVGYTDNATAAVGSNSSSSAAGGNVPAPTASIGVGATVHCWNGIGYTTVLASSATAVACAPFDLTWPISGHMVRIQMSGTTSPAVITRSPQAAATSQTDVTAQITPPGATITYVVTVDGATVADLTITVNLNTLEARGTYAAAPTP